MGPLEKEVSYPSLIYPFQVNQHMKTLEEVESIPFPFNTL